MRMKKIIAGIVAGALTVTSVAITSMVVNAEPETEFVIKDSGTKTTQANQYGNIDVNTYNNTEYDFSADDVITATVTAPDGVDTSKWEIAFCGFTNSWDGWQSVSSGKGELSLTATIGEIMRVNDIGELAKLGGFTLQVWHVGEEGDEVTVSYELTIIRAEGFELITEDSGTNKEFTANESGNIQIGQYEDEFSADDIVTVTVTAPDGVNTSEWIIGLVGFTTSYGGWKAIDGGQGNLSFTTTIGDIMSANSIADVSEFGGFLLQIWGVGEEGDKVTVSYKLTVSRLKEEEPVEYVVIFEDSDTNKECTANSYGSLELSQYATPVYAYPGTYEFFADDKITATITAPNGVDTSSWQVAFCGLGTWQSVNGSQGKLSFTSTIGKIMKANAIEDIADFGGFALQVWNVGEEGDKITVSYELTISRVKTPAEDITLNENALTLEKGDTFTLEATVDPENSTDKVVWSSDDEKVATVDENGEVTAVGGGTTTITATAGDVSATCKVTVIVSATGISLDNTTLTLEKGDTSTLVATVAPTDSTDKVVWSSSDEKVATVDESGKVTAISGGTATITATAGTASATCKVTVTVSATGVKLDKTTLTLEKGKTDTLKATVAPADSTDKVVWSSSDEDVATVDENGKVTAVAKGTATITATAGKASASCEVTVTVPVISVTLDKNELSLKKGETAALTATVIPADATDKTVTWESDNEDVATVDENGKVTAVASGTAVITVTASGKTAECTVTVTNPAEKIEIDDITVLTGNEKEIVIKTTPADADDIGTVTYVSEDETVAKVVGGKVQGVKAGTTTITATAGNLTAEFKVTVTDEEKPATEITLNKTTLDLEKGKSDTLTATVEPNDSTDSVVWSSDNKDVATVDQSGKVTAVGSGKAVITAKAGSVSATCEVTVTVPVTSVTLDKSELALEKGESDKLTATVNPEDATDKTVTWESGDPKVATVDENGNVTAVGGGTAVITAKAGNKTATCTVKVTVPVTSITLDKSELALEKGESDKLTAAVNPADATDKTVTWESDNEDVAAVDQNGNVTAVGGGTATITAKAGDKTAACEVTVTVPVTSVSLSSGMQSPSEISLKVGETATLIATVNPDDATDKTVTWTSSDETVATVVNGKITAVAAGTATITATSNADETKKASCTINVTEETKPEETEPEDTKPEETEPEDTKPEETEPEETQPEDTKPEETQPEETKPEETQPEETDPEETQPEDTKPEETQPEETEPDVVIPGQSDIIEGSESGETEVSKDTSIKIEIPELKVTLEAQAGTFEEAVTKIIAEINVRLAEASEKEKATIIAAAIKGLANASESVSVNDVISITLKDQDGNIIQPVDGTSVKVTLPYDGKSNYVAYIDGEEVEFIKLMIADGFASFEAKHFSDYYLVSLSDDAVKAVEDTVSGDTNKPSDDKNTPTGFVIALIPAAAAAAMVVVSKKRK